MDEAFPVRDHFKSHVIDGTTISKRGAWWSAVLLIQDPRSGKPFVKLYRWEKKGDAWKARSTYKVTRISQLRETLRALEAYADQVAAIRRSGKHGGGMAPLRNSSKLAKKREIERAPPNARRPAIRIQLPSRKR